MSGSKTWLDNDNADGVRPASITINLLADGEMIRSMAVTAGDGWAWSFGDLDYADANGRVIEYTVTEDPVPGYISRTEGYDVINTYTPELTTVSVVKIWDDDNDAAGMRPKNLIVTLSNGTRVTLNEENGWFATVTNLPKYVNGQLAVYTWKEQEVLGYALAGSVTHNGVTVLTNEYRGRKEPPEEFWNVDWRFGTEVTINHVGDCYD